MWNFKGTLWNSTQNNLPIHWKIWFLCNTEILRTLRFKSSYAFLKRPPVHIQSATCSMRALSMTLAIILHESHMSNSYMSWVGMIFTCKGRNVTTLSISMCSCKIFRDNKIDTHCYGMVLSFSDQYSNFHNEDSIWRCLISIRISVIEIRFSTMVSFQYGNIHYGYPFWRLLSA